MQHQRNALCVESLESRAMLHAHLMGALADQAVEIAELDLPGHRIAFTSSATLNGELLFTVKSTDDQETVGVRPGSDMQLWASVGTAEGTRFLILSSEFASNSD